MGINTLPTGPLLPGADDPAWRPTPKVDRFGDTIRAALKGPLDSMAQYVAQAGDSNRSLMRRAGDVGMAGLSGIDTLYSGGAGLVGEMFGGDPTQEKKLARDLMMMGHVAMPELAGGVVPSIAAGQAGARAAGRFAGDESGAIRAWHGSPYDFDRFSLDKIGTGEGAQAYGHGLYFADSKGVATSYRDALAPRKVDGSGNNPDDPRFAAGILFDHTKGDTAAAAALARKNAATHASSTGAADQARARVFEDAAALLDSGDFTPAHSTGRLYEVEIDANPEDFLDWDAPLSEQPEAVRQWALDNIQTKGWQGDNVPLRDVVDQWTADGLDPWNSMPELKQRGQDVYLSAVNDMRGLSIAAGDSAGTALKPAQGAASNELRQAAGVKGIRYFDQGSRGAGEGSRNYVVFDDNLINIVNKYGLAAALTMGGLEAADRTATIDRLPGT